MQPHCTSPLSYSPTERAIRNETITKQGEAKVAEVMVKSKLSLAKRKDPDLTLPLILAGQSHPQPMGGLNSTRLKPEA